MTGVPLRMTMMGAPLRITMMVVLLRLTGVGSVVILPGMLGATAWATTYYVSSSTGSDSNVGTSSSAAWQTIAHVNGQSFNPGDSILFKRGDVWNESLAPPSSGSSGNPITFDAYGTGAAPNLTGYYAVPATAWVLVTGNAWKAPVPSTYTAINFCLFGSVWGQKVAAVSSNLTAQWDFYLANGYVYVYSVGPPSSYYNEPIVPMALSNVPVININGQSWLTFQHFLVNWFDDVGVYVQGTSDHLVFANMEADSMIPEGTQPLGFYVDESAPGPGSIKIYNSEAHLNYDGFRFDGVATAITMVNDKGYANRDGALVDNTGAVTYSYCHFYASSLAVAGSTDVEYTSGSGPIAGAGNIAADTTPAVEVYQRYPARVTLTVDDIGMTPNADTYYAEQVLPVADAAEVPVGVAITVGYTVGSSPVMTSAVVSEIQGWINEGIDVTSHSISHTYYTNTDALDLQYTGSGSAATLSISGNMLTITVTGASDSVSYNLAQGQPEGTILGLAQALAATGKYTYSFLTPCQGPYGTGCSAYTAAALLSQDLADVSGQDVKSAVYHMQLNVTQLTTDEIILSRRWMTTNLTGLPATPVYVYPGGYETTAMQGIAEGVPYAGARGALKEDIGVKDTYADGFNVENITSFGVNPSWMGLEPTVLNQKIQALVWKESVWGVPWGIFWHLNELTQDDPVGGTEITNLIQDFKASGATIQTNTALVNWLLSGTQETGSDGNDYYKFPATSVFSSGGGLDFRPTKNSPVVDAGQNLGAAYELDINGVNQNSYGSGWEIGAHVYQGYAAYGAGSGSSEFRIGANLLTGPPNYAASTTSTANPGTIAPIFIAASPTVTSCSGMCQNSTAYDTTLNPAGVDCITRITDGTTFTSGVSVGNFTKSGGDNDLMGSVNETYLAVEATGGYDYILHMNTSGGCIQVENTGISTMKVSDSGFRFSKVTDTRFYYLKTPVQLWEGDISGTVPNETFTATELYDLTGASGPSSVQCPGVNWATFGTPTTGSILGGKYDDSRFGWSVGPGDQGSADWAFVWDKNLGCASIDNATGLFWNFCPGIVSAPCNASTPPSGTLSSSGCYGSNGAVGTGGIHDTEMSEDGNYLVFTTSSPPVTWTEGACGVASGTVNIAAGGTAVTWVSGNNFTSTGTGGAPVEWTGNLNLNGTNCLVSTVNSATSITLASACLGTGVQTGVPFTAGVATSDQFAVWQIGTSADQWAYGAASYGVGGAYFGAHESVGMTNVLTPSNDGPNIRPLADVASFTEYGPVFPAATADQHETWPHPLNDDSYPWCGATDAVPLSQGGPMAPNYLGNVVVCLFPHGIYPPGQLPAIFTHTFSCNVTASTNCASGVGDYGFGAQFSIGYTTQKGNFFCWVSTHLQSLGNDNTGNPRADGFCVHLE
ncbi:MAG: hypothetical protein ABSA78_18540 [Candidatus Sulfotelmatobacter sp.]|jgi:hypothetical protein